ncbi:hypothetical protein RN001_007302 [Aquatica leii]|uniref:Uncharacterized protein n=1 Tax=Aquatica leii TaxID=1421715 RepID=A0AAN7PCX4_9COLE|nr:hypothetical protein RN001_007302 [Aquatica leii]
MSRRVLSNAELLKELENLPQYESDCKLPSNNNSTDEDSDFVIGVPEFQKSSSDSNETTSLLSTLTRKNSIIDIASTSSCVQPIRSLRGTSSGTSKGRRSRGNRGRRLVHDKDTLGAESERVEDTGSDGTIWKILDPNQTFAECFSKHKNLRLTSEESTSASEQNNFQGNRVREREWSIGHLITRRIIMGHLSTDSCIPQTNDGDKDLESTLQSFLDDDQSVEPPPALLVLSVSSKRPCQICTHGRRSDRWELRL